MAFLQLVPLREVPNLGPLHWARTALRSEEALRDSADVFAGIVSLEASDGASGV